jgi:hypothetical protein
VTPAEIQKELDELESRLERLRIKYDQYFIGIEKVMPFVQRKDVDRRFAQLHKEQFRNGGLRFRFQTMVQRFTTYQTYWGRIIRQIEEGTYKRDLIRAQRLGRTLEKRPAAQADEAAPDPMELTDDDLTEATADEPTPRDATTHASRGHEVEALPDLGASPMRAPTPAPIPAPRPPLGALGPNAPRAPLSPPLRSVLATRPGPAPAPKPAPPADDAQLRALHQRFVEARRMTGENTDVQYESIARQARETLPRLAQKYQGAEVRLDVSIKDGKAVLKPIVTMPKKT